MISIESLSQQQAVGPPMMLNGGNEHGAEAMSFGRGISNDLPTAYVTSTPLPLAKAQQQQQHEQQLHHLPGYHSAGQSRVMSEEENEREKHAKISVLFEEIRIEAANMLNGTMNANIKQEDNEDQPTALSDSAPVSINKKLKKRKSELALEMTADEVDDILGDSTNSSFNPKNPFGGPSPSGFPDLGSPGSSNYNPASQKSSPPLSKYSQNNQGQRNSPPNHGYPNMSPYMTSQMNSPMHPQLQQQNSLTSSPPVSMHSPVSQDFKSTIINGHVMGAHHHHLPHHTRFLQHQQSAPNLRLGTQTPEEALPYQISGITPPARPFDRSLVEEFEMCVRAVLMASHRVYCRHVYRQLTAEVSELYARVAKNQVPKKAVKKIIAARQPATPGERIELERQFKCLADGLESRQSPQLYESILNFLYKMRVAIPDVAQQ
ncbi:uncharacterized protein CELE_R06C1.6 [Caenorhabditis elegans]|uniref:Uncharacterized protein n=1 Tax=Caenorhabditis elegans TaxID=6239 RepID=G5ED85_CAEEL|nr:Uncharacterized protein CELE_R06C1.6 [Caenorhabditis elegans]CAB03223.3 Uncharacterized protein CELE_R06C1.6 [Caenorhabditis elegans]|eukprot:NP_493030.3 Uncharacterized protein CELE_R06C1.6 [Caenorhabditis elegans]